MDRVNAQLVRLLSTIIQDEITDSSDLVTVTDVTTTRDLKQTTAAISAAKDASRYVALLNERSFEIRNKLRPQLGFKVIPYITFIEDVRGPDIARVEAILDDLS